MWRETLNLINRIKRPEASAPRVAIGGLGQEQERTPRVAGQHNPSLADSSFAFHQQHVVCTCSCTASATPLPCPCFPFCLASADALNLPTTTLPCNCTSRERMEEDADCEWMDCRLQASSMAEYRSTEYYSILESLQRQHCCDAEEHLLRSYLSGRTGLERLQALIQVEARRKVVRAAMVEEGVEEWYGYGMEDEQVMCYIETGEGNVQQIVISLAVGCGGDEVAAGRTACFLQRLAQHSNCALAVHVHSCNASGSCA